MNYNVTQEHIWPKKNSNSKRILIKNVWMETMNYMGEINKQTMLIIIFFETVTELRVSPGENRTFL